jgi:hypothetical protein
LPAACEEDAAFALFGGPMRSSWVVFTGFAVVAGACTQPSPSVEIAEHPIVAGMPDTGDPAIIEVLASKGAMGARCTATLISPRLLLLAEHCFVETPGFTYQVFPGNNDGGDGSAKGQLPIKTILHDPKYVTPRQGDDFAIVVLDTPMIDSPLPSSSSNGPPESPLHAPWGFGARESRSGVTVARGVVFWRLTPPLPGSPGLVTP